MRFIARCTRSGLNAVTRVWQWVLSVLSLLLVSGIVLQNHLPHTGPVWLKASVLVALAVAVLVEGAFQESTVAPPPTLPAGPPIHMQANVINYNVIDASSAQNVSMPPSLQDQEPPPDPVQEDDNAQYGGPASSG
ncbi:hypothetical protein [uncultured Jatrophihabitans sp.]|uniref:hypothetical protein n=1 Tax=uncultured Jatrophihabitans sp. TaxID=1610747 RepID=UPI0035CBAF88